MFSQNNSPKLFRQSVVSSSFKQFVTRRKFGFHRNSYQPTSRYKTQQPIKSSKQQLYTVQLFLSNKQQIRKLSNVLETMLRRKNEIENPEYQIDIQKDIEVWRIAIEQAKIELLNIRLQDKNNIKQRRLIYKQYQQMYQSLKQQIRNRNSIEDYLTDVQKQVEHYTDLYKQSQTTIYYLSAINQQTSKQYNSSQDSIELEQIYSQRLKQKTTLQKLLQKYDEYCIKLDVSLQKSTQIIADLKNQRETTDQEH